MEPEGNISNMKWGLCSKIFHLMNASRREKKLDKNLNELLGIKFATKNLTGNLFQLQKSVATHHFPHLLQPVPHRTDTYFCINVKYNPNRKKTVYLTNQFIFLAEHF